MLPLTTLATTIAGRTILITPPFRIVGGKSEIIRWDWQLVWMPKLLRVSCSHMPRGLRVAGITLRISLVGTIPTISV